MQLRPKAFCDVAVGLSGGAEAQRTASHVPHRLQRPLVCRATKQGALSAASGASRPASVPTSRLCTRSRINPTFRFGALPADTLVASSELVGQLVPVSFMTDISKPADAGWGWPLFLATAAGLSTSAGALLAVSCGKLELALCQLLATPPTGAHQPRGHLWAGGFLLTLSRH